MNTRGEIRARLKSELRMATTSSKFSDSDLNDKIFDATIWAADQFSWPQIERGVQRTTQAKEYYNYPSEFKSDSVYLVTVDGVQYDFIEFDDYQKFKRNNPNSTDKKLASTFGRQYFIYPAPTGTSQIINAWGLIQPPSYSDDNSKTIFSDSEASLNEAIMRKAKATCLKSATQAAAEETRAKAILQTGFDRIKRRRARFQKKDSPKFKHVDYFATGGGQSFTPGNTNRN